MEARCTLHAHVNEQIAHQIVKNVYNLVKFPLTPMFLVISS